MRSSEMKLSFRTAAKHRLARNAFVHWPNSYSWCWRWPPGVGALSGVQRLQPEFRATLLDESRTVMAADLTARQFVSASRSGDGRSSTHLAQRGVERTLITETISMAHRRRPRRIRMRRRRCWFR